MSTKSRQSIYGGRIMGAQIRAESEEQGPREAVRESERAEAQTWSIRMEGFGGPAQPSPTIGQCLNGGLGWLEGGRKRCKTRASLPLDAIPRPRDTPLGARTRPEMPLMPKRPLRAAGAHDQANRDAGDHAVRLGASGRGEVRGQGGP